MKRLINIFIVKGQIILIFIIIATISFVYNFSTLNFKRINKLSLFFFFSFFFSLSFSRFFLFSIFFIFFVYFFFLFFFIFFFSALCVFINHFRLLRVSITSNNFEILNNINFNFDSNLDKININ